jgi:hypothetical protein
MNKVKRLLVLLMVVAVASFCLTGCKKKSEHPEGEHPSKEAASEEHPKSEHPSKEAESEEHPKGEHPNGEHPNGEHPK